ncbi:TcmI family type II polyketide cyclase [Streptomyces lincolnensis]|uniref:TcmI family type II polyketide cyclase n=1 Tax=Streptomyces lincolnensis TaxID=1915 RepID=UPI0037CEFF9D
MEYQALMIRTIDPRHMDDVARIFAEHDQTTDLPRRIGVRRRELFEFHGLYLHLVESDVPFMDRLLEARKDPQFIEVDRKLDAFLRPYRDDTPTMAESRARSFYTWTG